mmetsp:Transcript_34934/g.88488  ORF Transcript_34934/g.88488 Transcript_34934/m.88488 type:complete len:318 (+) Transcript_34934:38-991(+)
MLCARAGGLTTSPSKQLSSTAAAAACDRMLGRLTTAGLLSDALLPPDCCTFRPDPTLPGELTSTTPASQRTVRTLASLPTDSLADARSCGGLPSAWRRADAGQGLCSRGAVWATMRWMLMPCVCSAALGPAPNRGSTVGSRSAELRDACRRAPATVWCSAELRVERGPPPTAACSLLRRVPAMATSCEVRLCRAHGELPCDGCCAVLLLRLMPGVRPGSSLAPCGSTELRLRCLAMVTKGASPAMKSVGGLEPGIPMPVDMTALWRRMRERAGMGAASCPASSQMSCPDAGCVLRPCVLLLLVWRVPRPGAKGVGRP